MPQKPRTNDDEWHAEQRKNWRRQLYPQWALVIVSVFGVAAAGFTLWFLWSTTESTREAADAAKTQAKAATESVHRAHRPWLAVLGSFNFVAPLTFDSKGIAQTRIGYTIKNGGTSPAVRAATHGALIVGPINFLIQSIQRQGICDKGFTEQATRIVGAFILPGDTLTQPPSEFRSGPSFPVQNGLVSVVVTLCVSYRDEFDRTHATGAAWIYKRPDGTDAFPPRGTVDGRWELWGIGTFAS